MDKALPNKWVKKAVFEAINNMTVYDEIEDENITVPCYDYRVTANDGKAHYVLMTTQTNVVNKYTKCGDAYESTILLDIVTSYDGTGNPSMSLLADNILDKVRELTNNLTLDVASGLTIHRQTQNFPSSIATITDTENIFRTFLRIELFIN